MREEASEGLIVIILWRGKELWLGVKAQSFPSLGCGERVNIGNSPITNWLFSFYLLTCLISERFSIFSTYTLLYELISSTASERDFNQTKNVLWRDWNSFSDLGLDMAYYPTYRNLSGVLIGLVHGLVQDYVPIQYTVRHIGLSLGAGTEETNTSLSLTFYFFCLNRKLIRSPCLLRQFLRQQQQ